MEGRTGRQSRIINYMVAGSICGASYIILCYAEHVY